MNSKERVLKTINHQEPDRVPIGEWGVDHDHISKILGRHTFVRNRKDTTLALWEGRRDEVVESLKTDYADLVEALDYDLLTVELVPPKQNAPADPPKQIADGVWEDKKGNVYKYASSNDSIVCVTSAPEKEELTEDDINKVPVIDESRFELINYITERFGNEKAIVVRNIDIYSILMSVFGGDYSNKLITATMYPEEVKKMYDYGLEYNKLIIEHCAKLNIDIAIQGHDFGMNSGCIISPTTLRDVFFPFMTMVNQEISNNGMIPFFHCCGNIWDILDDYVDAGYKGYQSIQQSASMDNKKVKQQYGKKLTLWTGVQCETLTDASMDDTEKEVKDSLKSLMPGGGFIFGSTNSVQFGAKTDNYLKALETVRKYGEY